MFPFPATDDNDPFAILILRFPAHGEYVKKLLKELVIWFVAPRSIIHGSFDSIVTLKAKGKLLVRAKEEEGTELELDGTSEAEGIDGLISFCKCSSCPY